MSVLTRTEAFKKMNWNTSAVDRWKAERDRRQEDVLEDEPESEGYISDARSNDGLSPMTWDDYVGQSRVKMQLQVLASAADKRGDPLTPMLMLSPPGSGKTTVVELLASELDVPLTTVTRPIEPKQLLSKIWLNPRGILFIDECHQQPSKTQHFLMQLTEDGRVDADYGFEEFPHLSVILATTEKEKIAPALRSRCKIVEWDHYTVEDMAGIVEGMATRADVNMSDDDVKIIAKASASSPRQARSIVQGARDMAAVGLEVTADTALSFADITKEGLTREHLAYLSALMEMEGRAGLTTIANRLRLHTSSVKEIERLLLDMGMIKLSKSGRVITQAGRNRIKN